MKVGDVVYHVHHTDGRGVRGSRSATGSLRRLTGAPGSRASTGHAGTGSVGDTRRATPVDPFVMSGTGQWSPYNTHYRPLFHHQERHYDSQQDEYINYMNRKYVPPMRKIIIAVLILIIVISSIPLSSIARTNTSALSVVLTYPYAEYSVGDVVQVQAHVFRHSSRYDPDVIDFRIGVDLRQLSMERMSPGLYGAELEITEADLSNYYNLRLEINVTRSGPSPEVDSFYTWLRLPEHPTYSVRTYLLDPSDAFPKYGQVVEFQVICRYGDQLVDPDPGSMRVTVDQYNGVFKETVEVTHVSTGLFRGNWTVSVDMNDADMYFIDGWARFSGESAHRMGSLDIFVSPIDVWINFIHVSARAIDADIYIHKDHQTPVEGAQVSLEIFFDDSEQPDDLVILKTGANGVANVHLDLEDVEPTPYEVTMVVKVQSDGISHEAFWTVGTDPVYVGRGFSKDGFAVTALDDMPIPECETQARYCCHS